MSFKGMLYASCNMHLAEPYSLNFPSAWEHGKCVVFSCRRGQGRVGVWACGRDDGVVLCIFLE